MATKNCLKISYKGLTRLIISDTQFAYDEMIQTVMDKFNIGAKYKLALEFYDEQGNKYNKDTFEYFMLLFPKPQKIFFIRMDASKIITTVDNELIASIKDDDRIPFGKSKLNNQQPETKATQSYAEAVPVRRQNCFLGELPSTQTAGSTNSSSSSATLASSRRNNSQQLALEIVKRMRLLKQNSPKKKHLQNNSNVFKRSLRI